MNEANSAIFNKAFIPAKPEEFIISHIVAIMAYIIYLDKDYTLLDCL